MIPSSGDGGMSVSATLDQAEQREWGTHLSKGWVFLSTLVAQSADFHVMSAMARGWEIVLESGLPRILQTY
jgi:hypothetical protein